MKDVGKKVLAFVSDETPYVLHGRVLEDMPSNVTTASGKWVNPLDLQPDDIVIDDIAHHLSNQCRWSGATSGFISVAQHCVLVSEIVPEESALNGLFHDAPEYVLQDMAKPLKNHVTLGQAYRGAERRIERVMAEKFGVSFNDPCVKRADLVALVTEARDLHHGHKHWAYYQDVPLLPFAIEPWTPQRAKRAWLSRYEFLTDGVVH